MEDETKALLENAMETDVIVLSSQNSQENSQTRMEFDGEIDNEDDDDVRLVANRQSINSPFF